MIFNSILIFLICVNFYIDNKNRKIHQDRIKLLESNLDTMSRVLYETSNQLKDQSISPIAVTEDDFQIVSSNLESAQDRLAELDLIIQNIQIKINKEIND